MPSTNRPTETYTAERSSDGLSWHVIQRRWRKGKRHHARPAPIERIIKTFSGPNAERLAFECVSRYTGKRDRARSAKLDKYRRH